MRKRAVAVGKVLGFFGFVLVLAWPAIRAVHAFTRSTLVVEGFLAAAVLAASWAGTKIEGRPLASVGFADRAPARSFGVGLMLGTMIVAGSAAIFSCLGWYEARLALAEPFAAWLVAAVALSALVALFEETLFRGYALQTVADAFGRPSAIIVTGVLFGALHLVNPTPGMAPWLKLVGCGCVAAYGMCAAIARLATGGLWLPIGMHFAWNLLEEFVFGFADSGVASNDALVRATMTGPVLLTGGAYGPEGGLVMFVLAGAAVAVLLFLASRVGSSPSDISRSELTSGSSRGSTNSTRSS